MTFTEALLRLELLLIEQQDAYKRVPGNCAFLALGMASDEPDRKRSEQVKSGAICSGVEQGHVGLYDVCAKGMEGEPILPTALYYERSLRKQSFLATKGHDAQTMPTLKIQSAHPSGLVKASMAIDRRNVNRLESVHGGLISTIVDTGGSLSLSARGLWMTGVTSLLLPLPGFSLRFHTRSAPTSTSRPRSFNARREWR